MSKRVHYIVNTMPWDTEHFEIACTATIQRNGKCFATTDKRDVTCKRCKAALKKQGLLED